MMREPQPKASTSRLSGKPRGLAVAAAAVALLAVSASAAAASPAPASLVSTVTHVPTSVTDAVGTGGGQVSVRPQAIPGTLLTASGKTEVLWIGANYCPYCGAERWSLIVALSRFGRFSGLSTIRSSTTDVYPGLRSWTFYGTRFTSKYLTFVPVEMYTNIPDPSTGGYTILQNLTRAQNALFAKWDAPPYTQFPESYPFIDFGNKYLMVGASYNPGVLSGLNWTQIAADLSMPHTKVAEAVDGTANYLTAALCKLTRNQPSTACTATIRSLEPSLSSKPLSQSRVIAHALAGQPSLDEQRGEPVHGRMTGQVPGKDDRVHSGVPGLVLYRLEPAEERTRLPLRQPVHLVNNEPQLVALFLVLGD
jgi:hypothetical protein